MARIRLSVTVDEEVLDAVRIWKDAQVVDGVAVPCSMSRAVEALIQAALDRIASRKQR